MRWLAVLLGFFLALSPTLEAIPTRGAAGYLDMPSGVRTYDGLNHTRTTGFDAANRPTSVTDPLAIVVSQTVFDAAGRVSQTKNGLNKTTQFFYDAAGRLSYTLDPLGRRIDKTFDEAGRQLTLKNRLSKTFSHAYGSDGLPAAFTFPSGRQSTIVDRDAAGRPKTLQSPGGQQAVLTYEGMGRIKTQADAVGTITWTYDNEGNPTNIAQGSANIARAYDNVGRMLSCTDASGNTVSYTYDSEGNTAKITYPGNKTVTYTYDGSNRLKTVTDWASRLTTYTYDAAGRLTQVDRPNGTRQRLQYDNADRLTASFEEKGATSLWQAGYGYDNAYRLTSYTPAPMTKTLPPPPATMTYDTDNRLATYNGQAVSSDANGNLLAAPVAGTLLGALTWDARNRLTSAGGVSYAYDAENRRISSTQSGQTTTYTWSRGAALDRLLVKTNPDGSVTRYIYGLGLISEETTPASGAATILFYHYNWQGSTMALSDASGNVTARLAYSPYGERTVVSGTVTTPFCFNGQFGVMTEPNGLLTMQARYYSPIFRRFLSEDPSGFSGGINLYAYTGGDPVNFMDPFGLGPKGVFQKIGSGLQSLFQPVATGVQSFNNFADNVSYYPSLNNQVTMQQVYRDHPNIAPIGDLSSFDYALTGVTAIIPAIAATRVAAPVVNAARVEATVVKETTYLYQKVGAAGEHLKFGITKSPATRYTTEELAGGQLKLIAEGAKKEMLQLERNLHNTLPIGPQEGQKFYIQQQIGKGLTPPPYSW